jgi:hypothetical protein
MMKYAVITENLVVDTTNSEHGASEYAARTNKDATLLSIVTEQDILEDTQYLPGKYIVTDIRTASLYEKKEIVHPGYFYGSTTTYEIKLIRVWTILEIADIVKQNSVPIVPIVPNFSITIGDKIIPQGVRGVQGPQGETGNLMPCVAPNNLQSPSQPITTKITNMPKPVVTINATSDPQLLSHVSLLEMSTNPQILSIGSQHRQHREKIMMIINHNLAIGTLKEEDIIIIVSDDKSSEFWNKHYSNCFVYGQPDDDLLYYLNAQKPKNINIHNNISNNISKLVIFDNCLKKEFIEKQQFGAYFQTASNYRVRTIVMTNGSEIIKSPMLTILNKVMLHSFTPDWTTNVSAEFIRRFPVLKDQKTLENHLVKCIRSDTCIVLNKNKPNIIESF